MPLFSMTVAVPIWMKWIAATSVLSTALRCFQPFFVRELLLKTSIRMNRYRHRTDVPTRCPSLALRSSALSQDEVDALGNLDYDRYSGYWYAFATNDPTQPSGVCRCDRFYWRNGGSSRSATRRRQEGSGSYYTSKLRTVCTGLGVLHMTLEGRTNATGGDLWTIAEGSPSFGAAPIPGSVLWVDTNYSATIRYFCAEEYLGVPVFSSMQIWTREPIPSRTSPRAQQLLRKAHDLLPFRDEYLDFPDHSNC